jgi:hypothetical protein
MTKESQHDRRNIAQVAMLEAALAAAGARSRARTRREGHLHQITAAISDGSQTPPLVSRAIRLLNEASDLADRLTDVRDTLEQVDSADLGSVTYYLRAAIGTINSIRESLNAYPELRLMVEALVNERERLDAECDDIDYREPPLFDLTAWLDEAEATLKHALGAEA